MNTSVFAPIIKKERQSDGTLLVTGIATDDTLDLDQQVCDPAWLERAMPEWFQYGNIREQHSSIAAGVATKLEQDGSRHIVTARVVDPSSVLKIEENVLRGFSIGIRDPRIVSDKTAPGGRIVDGQIVEVSLVDRPANPSCLITLAKTVGGVVQQTETLIEKEETMERCDKCGKAFASDDLVEGSCKECAGKAVEAEPADTEGSESGETMALEESEMEESSEHEEAEMDVMQGIVDALARIEAALVESGKMVDEAAKASGESIKSLGERLAKVEKSAGRGPVRAVTKTAAPAVNENVSKAAEYRLKAASTNDSALARGYLALAADLDN